MNTDGIQEAPVTPEEWMDYWTSRGVYSCDPATAERGFYLLNMFPYPKGAKHVAQARHFYVADAYARYLRLRGYTPLSPFGFDAFGLPAEHEARQRGIDPRQWTYDNMDLFRRSYTAWCVGYDPHRELVTCEPEYYRWTQWLFLLLLEKGIAYRAQAEVNWCTGCETVLADEQIADGACLICRSATTRRTLRQWFLRITDYAQRLVAGLDGLDWPEHVKQMQRNWIGGPDRPRLRDWLVSRQRRWGTPVPVVHCAGCGPVPAAQLPVAPLPEGPVPTVPCPRCGAPSTPDTDTLDTFVDSSWYFLRYLNPHDGTRLVDPELAARWLPVDLYIGGVSYATSHLIYARFITKVLHDLGVLRVDEPFRRLFVFGTIRTEGVRCARDGWLVPGEVGGDRCPHCGGRVERLLTKMATSRRNNVDVSTLGDPADPDPLRVGVLGLGPHDQDLTWSAGGIEGARRWLSRLRRLADGAADETAGGRPDPVAPAVHGALAAERDRCAIEVAGHLEALRPHLAISRLTTFTRVLSAHPAVERPALRPVLADLAVMLAPLAPVTAELVWRRIGRAGSVLEANWPGLPGGGENRRGLAGVPAHAGEVNAGEVNAGEVNAGEANADPSMRAQQGGGAAYNSGIGHHQVLTSVVFTGAAGHTVRTTGGEEYLDFYTNESLPFGHETGTAREALADGLPVNVGLYANDERAATVSLLGRLFPGYTNFQFNTSGTLANEGALRYAMAITGRSLFAGFVGSFHGRSKALASLTDMDPANGERLPGYLALPFPGYDPVTRGALGPADGADPARLVEANLAEVARLLDEAGAERFAAVMLEPILSKSVVAPPPGWLRRLKTEVLRPRGILLLADENFTSGRVGRWSSAVGQDAPPDVITFSKSFSSGYPFAGLACLARHAEATAPVKGGDAASAQAPQCRAVRLTVGRLLDADLLAHVRRLEAAFLDATAALPDLDTVSRVAAHGALLGIELASRQFAVEAGRRCLRRGVLVAVVNRGLRLTPALNLPVDVLLDGLTRIRAAIHEISPSLANVA